MVLYIIHNIFNAFHKTCKLYGSLIDIVWMTLVMLIMISLSVIIGSHHDRMHGKLHQMIEKKCKNFFKNHYFSKIYFFLMTQSISILFTYGIILLIPQVITVFHGFLSISLTISILYKMLPFIIFIQTQRNLFKTINTLNI